MQQEMSWRLPTINELQAMYDWANNERIEGFLKTTYWSSTILDNNTNVWIVNFCDGKSGYSHKQSNYHICCVRDNKNGGLDLTFSLKKMNWTQAMAYWKPKCKRWWHSKAKTKGVGLQNCKKMEIAYY